MQFKGILCNLGRQHPTGGPSSHSRWLPYVLMALESCSAQKASAPEPVGSKLLGGLWDHNGRGRGAFFRAFVDETDDVGK